MTINNINNTIDAIRCMLADSGLNIEFPFVPEERRVTVQMAQARLMGTVRDYETILPNWSKAPEWAQWYVVYGKVAVWWERKPIWENGIWQCGLMDDSSEPCWDILAKHAIDRFVDIPLGVDERECIWKKPGA